ncbi:MAG: hypothetical protein KatS3mg052_0403 [Candidatus Roseilinea sp.]|nr:MAG: hypothetical protein KatS3mg052_0403 [Candidatus Roseilinea sp.]
MHQPAPVRITDAFADLTGGIHGLFYREWPAVGSAPAQRLLKVLSLHQLHDDVVALAPVHHVLPNIVDRDDVGVVEVGSGLRFLSEALHEVGIAGVALAQQLDGNQAAEQHVLPLVHRRHAAGGQRS